jgi:hypothetical protein
MGGASQLILVVVRGHASPDLIKTHVETVPQYRARDTAIRLTPDVAHCYRLIEQ